jgi:hypothetical protein
MRLKALRGGKGSREKRKLIQESECLLWEYVDRCKKIGNPNGEAWGWLMIGLLMLERKVADKEYKSKRDISAWGCLGEAKQLFERTKSIIGRLEVVIGRGLGRAIRLCPEEEVKQVKQELKVALDLARGQKLQRQERLLRELLENVPGAPLVEVLLRELQNPRNPT